MIPKYMSVRLVVAVASILSAPTALWAQVAPPLGVAARFGALANSGVTGAAGAGVVVTGDVGSSPTATITNFPPSRTTPPFIVHFANDGVVQQARIDATTAYNNLAGQGPGIVLPDNLGGGVTLVSGIYSFATGTPNLPAGQTLTLNGGGVFVFNVGASLTFNVNSVVAGTANPCNIFWRIGVDATLNGVNFRGTVIANRSITLGSSSNVEGRLLAGIGATGAITMAGAGGNTIGGCSAAAACPGFIISPSVVPNASVGVPFSQQLTASGGTGAVTFTVQPGTLPAGFTLTTAGLLGGTPTGPEVQTFVIVATDTVGCLAQRSFTVTVVNGTPPLPGCPVITLSPTVLPDGAVGVAYSQTITASGGTAPFTFTRTAGSIPTGLTLTTAGVLAGTPTQTLLPDSLTIRGTDSSGLGCFAEVVYTMGVVVGVPTLPQIFVLVLALTLIWLGYRRLQQRQSRYTD